MMRKYNGNAAVIYNTIQLYRTDGLKRMQDVAATAAREGFIAAFKLVRGAYMEKERKRALSKGIPSPIHPTKEETDRSFNGALRLGIENLPHVAILAGTHNEASNELLCALMKENQISLSHPHIFFSQLYGMSDHISNNLAAAGYQVAKYVPYGKLKLVMPYLLRRAEENTSVAGQTGRELRLIEAERQRRRALKKHGHSR
jgi:proline dehydrogenase